MKKHLFLTLTIFLAGLTLSAQTIGTSNLYQKYRGQKGVVSLYIPGFAVRLASNIADLDHETDQLLRSIRSLRVLTIDDESGFEGVNFVEESRIKSGQGGFTTMMEVCDNGEDVMIMGKTKRGKLKDLLIIVGGEDNVLVHIKGRLNADMIGSLSDIAGLDELNFTSQL